MQCTVKLQLRQEGDCVSFRGWKRSDDVRIFIRPRNLHVFDYHSIVLLLPVTSSWIDSPAGGTEYSHKKLLASRVRQNHKILIDGIGDDRMRHDCK